MNTPEAAGEPRPAGEPGPGDGALGDWPPHVLEENGALLLARLRRHFERLRETPVRVPSTPVRVRTLLDGEPPAEPEDFETVLADTFRHVVPHLVQWNHPGFHAYLPNSSSGPGILAETLAAALNPNAMLWHTSPAASALEETVLRWLAGLAGYPPDAEAVLLSGASSATFTALAAARDALPGLDIRERGLAGRADLPVLRVYTSDQAHSSVDKAAIALGAGLANVVRLPTDSSYRLRPGVLDAALRADRAGGMLPLAVVATLGTTAVGALDPVPRLAEVCARHGVWLHVDAAYGGLWRATDTPRDVLPAIDAADSVVVNPHKTLFTPMHASALYCRRRGALAGAFRLVPEILRTDDAGGPTDFMDRSLELGRGFRALKIWWLIRCFGTRGIAARMERLLGLAEELRRRVLAAPGWELTADAVLPVVCLRHLPPGVGRQETDAFNARLLDRVNAIGDVFLSHAVLRDGYTLRVAFGNLHSRAEDVDQVWWRLRGAAAGEF
ncbi:pyridoxal phosphate-dependent decarboxylase family protein [Streptomyces specialis]|uniref:pyridoxal phosphate-dependent decarboxylase family protein n=1 Tax=Streptomyces specialis TaxID=498367 RepID=UPI00099ECD6A|nr:pyridoxal-dependent decarboxylase [Streptomyces specialis]